MMSKEDKYLDPKQNPWIPTGDEDGNPLPADDESPPVDLEEYRIPVNLPPKKNAEEDDQSAAEAGELEKEILKLMGNGSGAYEIVAEDGGTTPLFSVVRTAEGKLGVTTPDGETKDFGTLTALEKKLIVHDLKTRKQF